MGDTLILTRFAYTDMGTFGSMLVDGQTIYTVERPWLNNARNVSCIPIGNYRCKPRFYNRGGYPAVEICDVPNRSHILFHRGNTMHDVAGCVALNYGLGCSGQENLWCGTDSFTAFTLFMEHYEMDFDLEIIVDYLGV